jgi:hypothetical protein
VKLALDEQESGPFKAALDEHDHRVASELAVTEVTRACARAEGDRGRARARAALLRFLLRPVDRATLQAAFRVEPTVLRTLDAIHVATALSLQSDDVVFYAYDRRTIEAAEANGLRVASPGA